MFQRIGLCKKRGNPANIQIVLLFCTFSRFETECEARKHRMYIFATFQVLKKSWANAVCVGGALLTVGLKPALPERATTL
jgi:hypothetical protein